MNNELDKVLEKDKKRYMFLKALYEFTNGNTSEMVGLREIAKKTGLSEVDLNEAYSYLLEKGLVKHPIPYTFNAGFNISHAGVIEVEQSIKNPNSEPNEGIKQQADSVNMSSGMQAIQGDGNVQFQGNNSLRILIQRFDGIQLDKAKEISSFFQKIGLEDLRLDYTQRQVEAYLNAWDSLYALVECGDDLWEEATIDNLVKFAEQLRDTKKIARKNAPYFLDSDYKQLLSVLQTFEEFRVGKEKLIDVRSARQSSARQIDDYKAQRFAYYLIGDNGHHMATYKNIVDCISISFRQKLSK